MGGASGPGAPVAATNNADGAGPLHRARACYDMFRFLPGAEASVGVPNHNRWQQFRIIAYENHVAHFGNGMKLLEYVIGSPEWKTAYAKSQYAAYPGYGALHPGSIYLQHRGENREAGPKYPRISIQDWLGRAGAQANVRNAAEAWLPAEPARGKALISIWSEGKRIHSGMLPPR